MTEDITPQVLIQIRQEIATLGGRVDRISDEITSVRNDLTREMRHGFAQVNEQLSSVVALMGILAKNDDRLERRIQAIEARLAEPGH